MLTHLLKHARVTWVQIIARYICFAAIAMTCNLVAQRAILIVTEEKVVFAILGGTAVGLMVKYVLDRKWIFYVNAVAVKKESKIFLLYLTTGVLTTALFWVSEGTAWIIWKNDTAREIGAIFGLSLGYFLKYLLDRKYVFAAP